MMASDLQEPAMEPLSGADLEDTSERLEASSRASDTSRQQESPLEAGHHPVPRNGVPPKRLSMMTNRKLAAASTAAPRPTSSSASISGTGLSKPPTRPLPSSASRRTAAGVAVGSSSAHKKRASISSVDIKRKGDESATEEIIKASTNLLENRPLKNDVKKTSLSSTSHRTSLSSSSSADKRAASTRQNNDSPTKTALRPTTNSVRPNLASSTSQGTRPLTSSGRGVGGASAFEARKKRLSTIPASPVPRKPESVSSGPPLSPPTSTKPVRPPLGTRKSTVSISLEQSLREMEVVHKMLHVAMAEDADSTDEAKEEYGKKVDESLAAIRSKLEEARRSQGLDTGDSKIDEVTEVPKAAPLGVETHDEINELKSGLVESQSKVASLSAELAALESRVLQRDVNPEDALEIATETAEKLETHQHAMEKLRSEQNSKIEDLLAAHERDLQAAQSKTDEIEARHKEYTRQSLEDLEAAKAEAAAVLENEKGSQELDSKLQSLRSELAELTLHLSEERANGVSSASTIQGLQSEVSSLQQLVSETDQKHNDVIRKLDELDQQRLNTLKEKEDAIVKRDVDFSRLQSDIRDLEASSAQRLEKVKSESLEKNNALEVDLASARERLHQLEVSHQEVDTEHKKTLEAKQEEIRVLSLATEDLKTQMQQLQMNTEQGIDEAKTELLKDHEKSVLVLHDRHSEEIQALTQRHQSELETLRNDHQDSLLKLQTDKSDIQSSLDVSESALAAVKVQNAEASESIDALNAKLRTLRSERDDAKAAKTLSDVALQQASDEILSLKKCLDTIGEENRNREDEHLRAIRQIKDELEAAATLLDEKKAEAKSTLEAHAAELQELRTSHTKAIEELEKNGEGKLQGLHNALDELRKNSKQAEQDHTVELERINAAHNQALDRHMQDLESLRLTHYKEIDELKSSAERVQSEHALKLESSHTEKIAQNEKKYQQNIDELHRQYDEQCAALRKELEAAEEEKFEVAQQAHETAMSELTSQLQHQKERLTHTEQQLRVTIEAHDERVSPEKLTNILQQVEELKLQLANAHAEIEKSKDDVMTLAAALEDSSKVASDRLQHETSQLKNQHAAEVSKLQETIALENEKREKERKHGAEVRDRLAAESERMRLELLSGNERAAEQQKAIDISATELEEVKQVLKTALQSAERHESNCLEAGEGLKDAQAEIEELRMASLQAEKNKVTASDLNREIQKLQKAADAERERIPSLEDQLHEAQMISEKHAARVREVESALRLTTEKLVKLQTERLNELSVTRGKEDEELGPIIEGNIAGIKEQVRQLDNLNEDLIEEQKRLLSRITNVPHLGPNSNLTPANGPGVDEEEEEL